MKLFEKLRAHLALSSLCLGLIASCVVGHAHADEDDDFHDKLMLLGSGPIGGSFGPIGDSLCEALNAARKINLVRCISVYSAGSVFNIHAVANGSLQLGLGQEDLLAQAYIANADDRGAQLRTVTIMHNSPIGIMVSKASGIKEMSQIRKGVINIGNKGAGYHANAMAILKAMSLQEADFPGVTYLQPASFVKAFCEGKVDVIINALAHPSAQYQTLRKCGGEFIDIPNDIIEKMMKENKWLRPMAIPAGLYDSEQPEVKTLGMRNILFTNAKVDPQAIYRVAKVITAQHKNLQAKQPSLSSMLPIVYPDRAQLAVPLHEGGIWHLERTTP